MTVNAQGIQSISGIGDLPPVALGRAIYGAELIADTHTLVSPKIQSSALQRLAVLAPPKPAAPLAVKSAAPVQAPAPASEGIPTPVLIGGGVVAVLALAAVAYKLTR